MDRPGDTVGLGGQEAVEVVGRLAFADLRTEVQLAQTPAKHASGRASSKANQMSPPASLLNSLNDVNGTRQRSSGPSHRFQCLPLASRFTARIGGGVHQRLRRRRHAPYRQEQLTAARGVAHDQRGVEERNDRAPGKLVAATNGELSMPFVDAKDGTKLHLQDAGTGRPVVLIHGWPLTGDMFEYQSLALLEAGYRVITYDRRGFGQSGHPATGYDYDTFADDLAAVLDYLDVQGATLVGFSMGGGEIARYLTRRGAKRIAKAALISSVVPYLLKGDSNPDGVAASVFDDMKSQIRKDRFAFLQSFSKMFYGVGWVTSPVSDALLNWTFILAVMASPKATIECVDAFGKTDFRPDLKSFTMPTLVIHGTADKTVPIDPAGRAAAKGIAGATLIEYDGEPHGLFATAPDRLNADLIAFIG
jgi:non-heme chloroperoxidase